MNDAKRDELERIALEVRKDVVRMAGVAKSHGGLSSALTIVDILVYLYWGHMNIFPQERNNPHRDRLVLSSGFAAPALYACLSKLGFFERNELWSYRRLGGMLQGYPDIRTPGVDAPGGTSGLGIALGLALSVRMDASGGNVYCIMDREELRGGTAWESIEAAAANPPGNLVMIAEPGCQREKDGPDETEALAKRLDAFGWQVNVAEGHDMGSIERAFQASRSGGLSAIIAITGGSREYYDAFEPLTPDKPLSMDDIERTLSNLDIDAGKRGGAK
jgi:transketolase